MNEEELRKMAIAMKLELKETQEELEQLAFELLGAFYKWHEIRVNGSSSPVWTDGRELNYVRDSIIYLKSKMESLNFFPEVYNVETPDKMPERFMVKADEIRGKAKETLRICKEDENYKFLFRNGGGLEEEQNNWICLTGVLNSILRMERIIRIDNLVEMKKYSEPDRYLKSFKVCREQLEELLEELEDLKPEKEEKPPEIKYEQMKLSDWRKMSDCTKG